MAKPLPMRYCPTNGIAFQKLVGLPHTESLDLYREKYPNAVWRFNPWTGEARTAEDVRYDPYGNRLRRTPLRFLQLRHEDDIKRMAVCWTEDLRMHFEHWTTAFLKDEADPGEVLLIQITDSKTLVGITGWYPMGDGTAYLRWHGILPDYRRIGISGDALRMLSERLRTHYGIHTLYELAETEAARAFFQNRGWIEELDEAVKARVRNSGGDFRYVLKHYTDA